MTNFVSARLSKRIDGLSILLLVWMKLGLAWKSFDASCSTKFCYTVIGLAEFSTNFFDLSTGVLKFIDRFGELMFVTLPFLMIDSSLDAFSMNCFIGRMFPLLSTSTFPEESGRYLDCSRSRRDAVRLIVVMFMIR